MIQDKIRTISENKQQGFTIIELMLSMSMVSMLLIAIVLMSVQMGKIYTKGATVRDLNVASRTINDDFTKSFNSVPAIEWQAAATAPANGRNYVSTANGGAYCTGTASYLWNMAAVLNAPLAGRNVPVRYSGTAQSDNSIRLVKIVDPAQEYCSTPSRWVNVPRDGQIVDLLPPGESGLMIYGINFVSNDNLRDQTTNQRIVNINYILGTQDSNRGLIDASNMSCRPPSQSQGMEDYCAINRFDLTVRTLGRK